MTIDSVGLAEVYSIRGMRDEAFAELLVMSNCITSVWKNLLSVAVIAPIPDAFLRAGVEIQGRRLMTSDWMGDQPYPGMGGYSFALNYETVPEARRVFDTLTAGGRVNLPRGQTLWVESFGRVADRYGTPWMVNGGRQANPS